MTGKRQEDQGFIPGILLLKGILKPRWVCQAIFYCFEEGRGFPRLYSVLSFSFPFFIAQTIQKTSPATIATMSSNPNHMLPHLLSYSRIRHKAELFSETLSQLSFLDMRYQCDMRFNFWIREIKIRVAFLFIPDEVITPQLKQPVMNPPIVMAPDGSHMAMDILIPSLLRRVADILQIT
jgi:hypothetical protein